MDYKRQSTLWHRTTINISPEMYKLCYENRIRFSDAFRIGAAMMLADKGVIEYDNKLNLMRKLNQMREMMEKTSQELFDLREKSENKNAAI